MGIKVMEVREKLKIISREGQRQQRIKRSERLQNKRQAHKLVNSKHTVTKSEN